MPNNRKKTTFSDNKTCSLALQETATRELTALKAGIPTHQKAARNKDFVVNSVRSLKEEIQEHAARRVDLFFYLLVAVYKKHQIIAKADTILEHGKGREEYGTHACHSSLFPNVTMEINPNNRVLRSTAQKKLILSETSFFNSLNSTVELPAVVNGFDGHIEGRKKPSPVVTECLSILNKSASAEIDPFEGMRLFFVLFRRFFDEPHTAYFKKVGKNTPSEAKKQVFEFEKTGTFFAAEMDNTVRNDYVHMMLRVSPEDIERGVTKELLESTYYPRIQSEIFSGSKPA